ncbi:hypothetical protein BDF20DRAFT_861274 [Mycotypha africana]|uniref:uncharacterized protein n=1 Tax=Mycotypha africana TaxID=64632 RepID=UPI002300A876|nr:uncharacterized protein BDF20DRAFT_861274 [Mycotypha africana]KAI8984698.1 hypothetical protein BDF20DRAFT_861274 [Mycotypha africana]
MQKTRKEYSNQNWKVFSWFLHGDKIRAIFNILCKVKKKRNEVTVLQADNDIHSANLECLSGNHVLVTRVQSIIPFAWKSRALIFHSTLTVLRFLIGIVDVATVHLSYFEDGSCEYYDAEFWGPVYTLYDTVVDFYVTLMISIVLISHIRSIISTRMKVNTLLYTSVIYNNVLRTLCITIVNLMSTLLIIMENKMIKIMLLWPIINILIVCLVGYDSDVTKAIQKIRQRHWQTLSATATSVTLDLNEFPMNEAGLSHLQQQPQEQEQEQQQQQQEQQGQPYQHFRKPSLTRRHSDSALAENLLSDKFDRNNSEHLSITSHWKSVVPLTATNAASQHLQQQFSPLSDYDNNLLHNLHILLSNTSSLQGSTSNNTIDSYVKGQSV